jgi:hypothetical protein
MILADDEGKLHLKYTCCMHIHTHILFYNIVEYMMYIQSHIHTHTIFIYISGLKDDSCGRRGPAAPGAQVQKYQHWRNFLALLVLADDEGRLADDEMSRASCSGHDEGELHWKYTCVYMFLVY